MPRKPTDFEWRLAEEAIRAYAEGREKFRNAQVGLKDFGLLQGHDNKIGIIGEYEAIKHYLGSGWKLVDVPRGNNPGYDLEFAQAQKRLRVSVKVVSDESEKGKQLPLKPNSDWDELILILLRKNLRPYRLGVATRQQFTQAQQEGDIGSKPVVSRTWLNPKGWLRRYGHVIEISAT